MEKHTQRARRMEYQRDIRIGPGWFGRWLAFLLGAVTLVAAAMLSVILLATVLVVGTAAFGYFWWKTRTLRRQMRAQQPPAGFAGRVVEAEVVRVDEADSGAGDVRADDTPAP